MQGTIGSVNHAIGTSGRRAITTSLVVAAATALLAQGPSNPFPNHARPPDGWYCTPAMNAKDVKNKAHSCGCLGMVLEPICPETPEQTRQRQDSKQCKTSCYSNSCLCAKHCNKDT